MRRDGEVIHSRDSYSGREPQAYYEWCSSVVKVHDEVRWSMLRWLYEDRQPDSVISYG